MKLQTSDPDIETVVARIRRKDLDLQPDFQRGEVWSNAKKQRLVDSILREWHVPPIHVVVTGDKKELVLDGQQRLAAVRDFVNGVIPVDGTIPPESPQIRKLDGLHYAALPADVQRRLNSFSLRLIRITEYEPQEPGELFFRLNQPSNLTAAEQRNAFFGPARAQVKSLVDSMAEIGLNDEIVGFSNARMAYHDVVSRLCEYIESGSLHKKITASELAARYRTRLPFSDDTISGCQQTLVLFADALRNEVVRQIKPRFNKATLFSWLYFVSELRRVVGYDVNGGDLAAFVVAFENIRTAQSGRRQLPMGSLNVAASILELVSIFNDRSTSRVADVSSVILRDIALKATNKKIEHTAGRPVPS